MKKRHKIPSNFRLSPSVNYGINTLSNTLKCSRTDIVEMAVTKLMNDNNISVPSDCVYEESTPTSTKPKSKKEVIREAINSFN